jgi:Concanavalin A-like lectin/glucanases superfamily
MRRWSRRGLGMQVAWTPSNLGATLIHLWNASKGLTLSGSDITSWADQVGSNALVSTTNPVVATPGGVQAVSFGGASVMSSSSTIAVDAFTYFGLFQSAIGATPGVILERSVNANSNTGEFLYQDTEAIFANRSGTPAFGDFSSAWGCTGAWIQFAYTYSSAAGGNLYINGGVSPVATFAGLSADSTAQTLFVGARSGVQVPLTGYIRELGLCNSVLSATQLQQVYSYEAAQV